jgi:hypothetical protein
MPSSSGRFGSRATALTLCGLAVLLLSAIGVEDPARAEALLAEGAVVEWLQVALMSGAAVLAAHHGWFALPSERPAVLDVAIVSSMTMAIIGEVDLDRALFGTKLIATQFFVNPGYPLSVRLLTVLIVVGVPAAVGLWLLLHWRALLRVSLVALREPWGQVAAAGAALYILIQVFERPIGHIPWQPRDFIEETLELASAICIFVGVFARRPSR